MTRDPAEQYRESTDVQWDDLRHRRVLDGIHARLEAEAGAGERSESPGSRRWVGVAIAAAAAAMVVWGLQSFRPSAPVAVVTPAVPVSTLQLTEDVQAELFTDAEVAVADRTEKRVAVKQARGAVRYTVVPDKTRAVEVTMEGVHIRVLGTVFDVRAEERAVLVAVERGKVQVTHAGGVSILRAGQSGEFYGEGETSASGGADPAAVTEPATETAAAAESETEAAAGLETPAAAKTAPTSAPARPADPAALLASADDARARGNDTEAISELRALVRAHPTDPRAITARFTLGRLYAKRGQHGRAAAQFGRAFAAAPAGPLAEDALAEQALQLALSGKQERATVVAKDYLTRFPAGPHADRLRTLISTVD